MSIEIMSQGQIVAALERIACAFESIAKTLEMDFQRRYPSPKPSRDALVTHIETDEERLQNDQTGTDRAESLDRWTEIGEREALFDQVRGED